MDFAKPEMHRAVAKNGNFHAPPIQPGYNIDVMAVARTYANVRVRLNASTGVRPPGFMGGAAMVIELNKEEFDLLKGLVEARVRELGPEIHHTHSRDFRDSLERTREVLAQLVERLTEVVV